MASGVRLDKWLWAARFFKTRAKAKDAVDGGKVHLNGNRTKPSKEVNRGDTLRITQGFDEKVVTVVELSEQRRGATDAMKLYEETEESAQKRELRAEQRRAAGRQVSTEGRPSKRDRRLIHRFREDNHG